MKKIFFTPGPSELYKTVPGHLKKAIQEYIPSLSHRSDIFHSIYEGSIKAFKKLYGVPKSHRVFFLSSATEAMERIIENLVLKDSLHYVNGAFSELFYRNAISLGVKAQKIEVEPGTGFEMNDMEMNQKTELACFTQNETSTGVIIPMEDIYKFKKNHPETIIAVDIVSSAPFVKVDFTKVDCTFFSVQKGFGLPAGLGVLIVHPKVFEKVQYVTTKKTSLGSYHTFDNYKKYDDKKETPETPNVLGIYLFGKVCEDLEKVGLQNIRKETEIKARDLYELAESDSQFEVFVKEKRIRSSTVIVLNIKNGSKDLIAHLKRKGYIIGSGYRDLKEKQVRIANFPQHTPGQVKRLIKEIKTYQKT